MKYNLKSSIIKTGNKHYIAIPFNVWEQCGRKGMIPVKVKIQENEFECKLIPKGKGFYHIPVKKQIVETLNSCHDINVEFELIDGLNRIRSNSPYSKENPIRKIDSIEYIKQPRSGLCGQTCLAMLAGISVEEVINIMKSKQWEASISKVLETLDYCGFIYNKAIIYTRGKEVILPVCCILNVRGDSSNHLLIHYKGTFYDPTYGILSDYQYENIISYIEIII